jgi:luciferase family oxidoreductase group 1
MAELALSVLDQSPIRKGGTPADAVRETIELARHCDALGYRRYWIAEHHNSGGLASASPEILIGHVAANTRHIRVGSCGVMLSHYSPLRVAEQFRMLEALHPGRIDLGLGRAPGSDRRTAEALSPTGHMLSIEHYPEQLLDLYAYLTGEMPEDHPYRGIRAQPAGDTIPELWLLGSSPSSASYAAELGWPFCWAHFINPEGGEQVTRDYRERFQPSPVSDEPRVSVAVSATVAETDEEAEYLSWSRWAWRLRSQQGRGGGIPSPEEAHAIEYSEPELDFIAYARHRSLYGSPGHVRDRIEEIAEAFGASEVVVVTITYDFEARKRSYALLAKEFGLRPPDDSGPPK